MDIFSYHLIDAPVHRVLARLLFAGALGKVDGLRHSECLLTMKMGASVMSPNRYNHRSLAFFAWWRDESALEAFLERPPYRVFEQEGWHVRMKFYRKWGNYAELDEAPLHTEYENPDGEVVAVTLARLKLKNTLRFARWGKPVERQVRDHEGQRCARVAFRPLNTFSTFSIWETEEAMRGMVRGLNEARDGTEHRNAMVERARNPFHHEFMTLRFAPLSEHGTRPDSVSARPPVAGPAVRRGTMSRVTEANDARADEARGEGAGAEGSGGGDSLLARYGFAVLLGLAASGLAWWLQQHEFADTVTPAAAETTSQDGDDG